MSEEDPQEIVSKPFKFVTGTYGIIPRWTSANVRSWYDEMPKVQRVRNVIIPQDAVKGGLQAGRKTLEGYMKSSACVVCRARLPPMPRLVEERLRRDVLYCGERASSGRSCGCYVRWTPGALAGGADLEVVEVVGGPWRGRRPCGAVCGVAVAEGAEGHPLGAYRSEGEGWQELSFGGV